MQTIMGVLGLHHETGRSSLLGPLAAGNAFPYSTSSPHCQLSTGRSRQTFSFPLASCSNPLQMSIPKSTAILTGTGMVADRGGAGWKPSLFQHFILPSYLLNIPWNCYPGKGEAGWGQDFQHLREKVAKNQSEEVWGWWEARLCVNLSSKPLIHGFVISIRL